MKLKSIILENFRGYKDKTIIDIGDLTTLIGKNDAGKSTVLEALEIFFNDEKIEQEDLCVYNENNIIIIGCVFNNLPDKIVLDSSVTTSLKNECILNKDGDLEIIKKWDYSTARSPKIQIFSRSWHPSDDSIKYILTLKNSDLKKKLKDLSINSDNIDLTINSEMRDAIRKHVLSTTYDVVDIPLDKEDSKKIYEQLKIKMPVYALFRSDRASNDSDDEVQSPFKSAIIQAIKEAEGQLNNVKSIIQLHVESCATRTLEKLHEIDSTLAEQLKPSFKADPKWETIFKFGLLDNDDISVNKRGSGTRRLILLSFFRAEAEQRKNIQQSPDIIYAIEEPETSQHPNNQKLLVKTFKELADSANTQIIITSHTPSITGLLPLETLRHISKSNKNIYIKNKIKEQDLHNIASELGILPDDNKVKVLFCVEGTNDVAFFERMGEITEIIDFDNDSIAVIPLGGGSLKQWVNKNYLKKLKIPEAHIYDKDLDNKYQSQCDTINGREDGSWATLTTKREIENYLHPTAIKDGLSLSNDVEFKDEDDVSEKVAQIIHNTSESNISWEELECEKKDKKISKAKKRLNSPEVLNKMNSDLLRQSDLDNDIKTWLTKIKEMVNNSDNKL